jgi:S1-C subfamily serine protease
VDEADYYMAAGQDSQDCLDIPAVLAGQTPLGSVHSCSGSLFHDSYLALAPKVAKVETTTAAGAPDSGTAFFVQDGTHMVTSGHVVEHSPEVHVDYQGKKYAAVVEKLDDTNDLAELKVIGLDADPSRAQKVGPVALTANEKVVSVGVPGTDNQVKYINPGVLVRSMKLFNVLNDPSNNNAEAVRMKSVYDQGDAETKQIVNDVANSPRLIMNQGARWGQSGSPIVDQGGNLVGVVTALNGNNATVDVPFTKVQDLLNSPENKFNLNYSVQHKFVMPSLTAALTDTAGLGAEAAGLLGKGRLLPLAYAGVRAASLFGEVKDLTKTTDSGQKHDLEVNIAQDGAMVAGGVAATALWSSPVGRIAGLGVMGLSLASRFITDSQEKHYLLTSITRKNGDTHAPWSL